MHVKIDPYGRAFEYRPGTAGRVPAPASYSWDDAAWMQARRDSDWQHTPMSIYEVHLGSWRRGPNGEFLSYLELAEQLIPYVAAQGFTHIELLPVTEHPLDDSWGYQATGYYAPTSRHGTPDEFRTFVDQCHQHGIGVILDWAPGHFPKDDHALARFDGSALYEHEDPRRGEHREWGTLIFNYGRNEVRNFLLSSALFWIEECHIDGLRVDAVASMLYLDYSREAGEWLPNMYGGRENLEAIDFLRQLNQVTHGQHPGTMMIAEESTAWPQVTRPAYVGGLGFSMKWNMGWMHDTLIYFSKDPVHRQFPPRPAYLRSAVCLHRKFRAAVLARRSRARQASMLHKMPGDEWQQFANLRLLYTYLWTYPGKKLLFMGSEFGQRSEWNCNAPLEWQALEYAPHVGVQNLVRDLNRLYREEPALHRHEFESSGFDWIDCHDCGAVGHQLPAPRGAFRADHRVQFHTGRPHRLSPGRSRARKLSGGVEFGLGVLRGRQYRRTDPAHRTDTVDGPSLLARTHPAAAGGRDSQARILNGFLPRTTRKTLTKPFLPRNPLNPRKRPKYFLVGLVGFVA